MSGIKYLLVLSVLLAFSADKTLEQKGGTEQVQKAPQLKPNQLEFAKGWWKKLGEEQKDQASGTAVGQKKKKRKQSPLARAPVRPSGDTQFLDSMIYVLFPVGDRIGGIPDDVVSVASYCIQFVINGIIVIAYTTVRWPHKILLKTMIALGVLTFLPTNTLFCLNPLSIYNFVRKGTIINKKMDELSDLHDEFKKRLSNSMDKIGSMMKMQKHSCCAWFEWKRKNFQTVAPEARDFLAQWFTALYKIHEIIYCQTFSMKQAQNWCNEFEFLDMEPTRVLPRSWLTICMELFARFF